MGTEVQVSTYKECMEINYVDSWTIAYLLVSTSSSIARAEYTHEWHKIEESIAGLDEGILIWGAEGTCSRGMCSSQYPAARAPLIVSVCWIIPVREEPRARFRALSRAGSLRDALADEPGKRVP